MIGIDAFGKAFDYLFFTYHLEYLFTRDPGDYGYDISTLTPMNISVPVFNLWEGLLDTRIKMTVGDYGMFTLIEDYRVRMLSYGNAAGGRFFGPYRSFLVRVNGNVEFYSIGVTTYCKSTSPDKVKTCIAIAHDDEKESHHALQLVADDNLMVHGNKFYLGSLTNDRLFRLDDPDVIHLIVNLIYYAMIRDEYREYVKRNKQ